MLLEFLAYILKTNLKNEIGDLAPNVATTCYI